MRNLILCLVLGFSLVLAACDFNGGVEQGRCVGFDAGTKTVTLVEDTALDQHNPHYSGKVLSFKLPENPLDVGPLPVAGGLVMLEPDKGKVLYYDSSSKSLKELSVEFVSEEKGVTAKDARLKDKTFPIIDRANRTVTVYSPRLEELVTFKIPETAIDLPPFTWELGDEVRIAYRNDQPGQAIRFMNVTKTSIFTR